MLAEIFSIGTSGLAGIVKGYSVGSGQTIQPDILNSMMTYGPVAASAAAGAVQYGYLGAFISGEFGGETMKGAAMYGAIGGAVNTVISGVSMSAGFGIGYGLSKMF